MRQALTAILLLLACAVLSAEATAQSRSQATAIATGGNARAMAVSSNGASAISESTALYEFDFSYPAAAGRIPRLRAMLDRQRQEQRADLIDTARGEREQAKADGFPYRPHSLHVAWQTVADLPRWLSLSAGVSTYTGGAHPNHGFDALLWDKSANVRREPIDLFFAPAFVAAVKQRFCAALDRQRAKKRDGESLGEPGDWMNACIDPVNDATVILGSSNGETFDRIGFLVAPYAAGPYAEGDYEVTLPVDRAIMAAVRPEYRRTFALGR